MEAEYPPTSVAYGTVVLQVTVGKLGSIDDVKVIHDIPSLTQEAERTVRKWKFRPATFDGKPVASLMVASFTFSRPFIRRGKF
ncbi:MAG: energy transducer TonB [Terriglobia bacterium]